MYLRKITFVLFLTINSWAYECPKGFFCASGCGLHEYDADAEARAQLAKIFNVKINSQYTTITSTMGELDEVFIHEAISEYVLQNLEGVVIKSRKEDSEGEICAHAVLNKTLFTDRIKKKINSYVKESQNIIRSKKRLALERVRDNNRKIAHLSSLLSVVEIDAVSKQTLIPKQKRYEMKMDIVVDEDSKEFKEIIISRLNRNGVFHAKSAKDTLKLVIKLNKKIFNVTGFEKHELKLNLSGYQNLKKQGEAAISIIKIGRNKQKIKEEIYKNLKNEIHNIFLEINI